jgi:hypothetical protein
MPDTIRCQRVHALSIFLFWRSNVAMLEASQTALAHTDDLLSRLVLQPADDPLQDVCGFYCAANMYVACGLQPPPIEHMFDMMLKIRGEVEPGTGLTGGEIAALLQAFGFPRALGVISLPATASIWGFVKASLAKGFQLILRHSAVTELTPEGAVLLGDPELAGIRVWWSHGLIPLSADDNRRLDCIVGWEAVPTAKVEVKEFDFPDWFVMLTGRQPVGFSREILMVWPDVSGMEVD